MDYIAKYEKEKQKLENNRETFKTSLQKAQTIYDKLVEEYNLIKNDNSIDTKQKLIAERKVEISEKSVQRYKRGLQSVMDKFIFLRPANEKDIAYRFRQIREFPRLVKQNVPENLHICFHGCLIETIDTNNDFTIISKKLKFWLFS